MATITAPNAPLLRKLDELAAKYQSLQDSLNDPAVLSNPQRLVAASKNVAIGWLLTTPHEPPVLNSSMREIVLVFAATENWSAASNAVFVSQCRQVNTAASGVF